MNRILSRYLDEIRMNLAGLGLREREDVLAEIAAHLEQAAAAHRGQQPGLSDDEAYLRATSDFGEPREIGIRHGPSGGVVRRSTGEVLIDVAVLSGRGLGRGARAAGRGARAVLKWTAITAASLVAVAVVVALVVLVTFREPITAGIEEAAGSRTVYAYNHMWPLSDPQAQVETDSFDVRAGMRLEFQVQTEPTTGCAAIQLIAPDGSVAYQNGSGCSGVDVTRQLTQSGTYQVRYAYVAFSGAVRAHGIERPA
ncbi:MAG TPA: permease prefix domain 1-containing protein [Candidatus Thermoplasmatota archaeon]|nr:permease prefix domain 1-containing protein [Candidatus Thermoplasmatota archaeon]